MSISEEKFSLEWRKRILGILGFFGMALMYSLRFNLSIGIVAMVDHQAIGKIENNSFSHAENALSSSAICPALLALNLTESNGTGSPKLISQGYNDKFQKFDWNEKEQGLVLGCFFFGYIITQFPGGLLAQRWGGKWVFSLGLLGAGLLSLIFPFSATTGGIKMVVFVRFLQGISEGVMIPAFATILSKWTEAKERASMATFCFSGMPFGTAMTMIVSSHLISTFGWPAVFYVPGLLTVIWCILWSVLVTSSPKVQNVVSLNNLKDSDASSSANTTEEENTHSFKDIPWRQIFTSVPFWAILASHFANTWGHNTLKTEGPKYLHSVLHFDIHENALIAATPYLCQWIFCITITRLSDYFIRKEWISISTSRKLCNTIGQAGTAIAYGSLALCDCNRSLAITAFVLSGLFNGAVYGGFLINPVDISPNYAGVIEGLINGISNVAGFGAPFVAGIILHNNPTLSGWKYVFLIPAIGDFIGNLIFALFSSTKPQPWDKKCRKGKYEAAL